MFWWGRGRVELAVLDLRLWREGFGMILLEWLGRYHHSWKRKCRMKDKYGPVWRNRFRFECIKFEVLWKCSVESWKYRLFQKGSARSCSVIKISLFLLLYHRNGCPNLCWENFYSKLTSIPHIVGTCNNWRVMVTRLRAKCSLQCIHIFENTANNFYKRREVMAP